MSDHEREPNKHGITIYEIATHLGLNPSTVSRALTRPGRVSARTEARVKKAAAELNYQPNLAARALPTGRMRTLGLLVADIANPMFFEVMRGAQEAAVEAGYTLVLAESQQSTEREATAAEQFSPWVDGIILLSTRQQTHQIQELAANKPLVVLNREVPEVVSIVPAQLPGVAEAMARLSSAGHSRIAYLPGPESSWMSHERERVIRAAGRERGLTVATMTARASTVDGGRRALLEILESGVSAVFAYNDLMGIGLLQEAEDLEIPVPGRLGVIGFDGIFGSDLTMPRLSTISAPLHDLGLRAVDHLLGVLDRNEDRPDQRSATTAKLSEDLRTTFLERSSIGERHARLEVEE